MLNIGSKRDQKRIAAALQKMTAAEALFAMQIIFRYFVALKVTDIMKTKQPKLPFIHMKSGILCTFHEEYLPELLRKAGMAPLEFVGEVYEATAAKLEAIEAAQKAEGQYLDFKFLYENDPVLTKLFERGTRLTIAVFTTDDDERPAHVLHLKRKRLTIQKNRRGAAAQTRTIMAKTWKKKTLGELPEIVLRALFKKLGPIAVPTDATPIKPTSVADLARAA